MGFQQERILTFVREEYQKFHIFKGNDFEEVSEAAAGEIIAISGIQDITVGETVVDPENPQPLPMTAIDPPTISVEFLPNDSPFAGKEGEFPSFANCVNVYLEKRYLMLRFRYPIVIRGLVIKYPVVVNCIFQF